MYQTNSRTKPREVVSIGDISKIEIPNQLPYYGALSKICKEATGTGVTINIDDFYSEAPIVLHNFVSKIIYRFIDLNGTKAIAYYIEDRDIYDCSYKEIDYMGNELAICYESKVGDKNMSNNDFEIAKRAYRNLGIFWVFVER